MLKSLLAKSLLLPLAFALSACCNCDRRNVKPVPPPISLAEQVNRLNDRARTLTKLTMGGTVVIRYHDDKGDQQQTAEGRLLIQQHPNDEGDESTGGDVFISGRAFGQEVFRAGKNDKEWFFLIYLDPKRAWIGPVGSENAHAPNGGSGGGAVMRADTVLEVLGITTLPAHGSTVSMLVHDLPAHNQLLELKTRRDQPISWVKRELLINRRTGDVDGVNLYDPNGILLVKAQLKNYRDIRYREGDDVPEGFKPPRFPFDMYIEYVAQKASIHFTVADEDGKRPELRENVPAKAFETPTDLEGFKVDRR